MTCSLTKYNFLDKNTHFPSWIVFCYLVAFGLEFLSLFINIRSGVAFGIYNLVVLLYIFAAKRIKLTAIDFIVLLFAFYNLFSIFGTLSYGESFNTFLGEFCTGILPITFYFVARCLSNSRAENKFLLCLFFGIIFVDIIGIYFYYFNPSIYIGYLQKTVAFFDLRYSLQTPMLESFIGGSVVGVLSNICVALCMHFLIIKKNKRKFAILLCVPLFVFTVVLTLERVSWVCTALTIVAYIIIASKHKVRSCIFMAAATILLLVIISNSSVSDLIVERIKGSDTIFTERSANWLKVFEQDAIKLFFGNGLGTCGHRSKIGLRIVDGNYFKMIYEVGIFGTFIMASIILSSAVTGILCLKNSKDSYLIFYLAVVFIIIIQGIGASAFTFQDEMPIFWFAIGMIFNQKKARRIKQA